MKSVSNRKDKHNEYAPFWALALVLLCLTGLSTNWFDLGIFFKGYVLDMTGPAWSYILFRGLYTSYRKNRWTLFFTPRNTLIVLIIVSFGIEGAQFLKLYPSTFDPWDFVAYLSILVPLFLLDSWLVNTAEKRTHTPV
ncbi:hypothetical protein GF407_03435 [candidate division KSB1 bacterium]|nr:hypothetical protein [candidate division KSB1 bacterium]